MQAKIIEFTNLLRKSGIRVSVAEAIDAFQAIDELSLGDREVFQDALRSSMVKRGDEISTFDQLFELFFSGVYDNLRDSFSEVGSDMAVKAKERFRGKTRKRSTAKAPVLAPYSLRAMLNTSAATPT